MERGHPVSLSAKREQPSTEDSWGLSVLRTLADRDVRTPLALPVLTSLRGYPFSMAYVMGVRSSAHQVAKPHSLLTTNYSMFSLTSRRQLIYLAAIKRVLKKAADSRAA